MLWLWLAVGSAAFLGVYDVSKKVALQGNAVLPTLLVSTVWGWLTLAVLIAMGAVAPALADLGLVVEPLGLREHGFVLGKALLVSSSWMLSFYSVKHLPVSLASPLRASSPLFTVLGAVVLLAERPTPNQWLGIFVTLVGYVGFAMLGRKEGIRLEANRWVALLVLAMLLGAASGIYDKYLLGRVAIAPTTLQFWFATYNVLVQAVVVGALWWRRRSLDPFVPRWTMALVGSMLIVADQLYFHALSHPDSLVSVVSLVRRGSVLITFTAGGMLLREERLRHKAVALAFILVGVAVMFVK